MQPAALFAVLAVGLFVEEVATSPLISIGTFLKSLQQRLKEEQDVQHKRKLNSDRQDDVYGSLKQSSLDNLLSYSIKNPSSNTLSKYYYGQPDRQQRSRFNENDELLSNVVGINDIQDHGYSSHSDQRADVAENPASDYSKVYVVLNSEALKKAKNKEKLNALLSSLLAAPPAHNTVKKRQPKQQRYYYKYREQQGSPDQRGYGDIKTIPFEDDDDDDLEGGSLQGYIIETRRNADNSKSKYVEDQPAGRPRARPQQHRERGRALRGGRGGGGGGHTAIPYLNQRGDIYEKDM